MGRTTTILIAAGVIVGVVVLGVAAWLVRRRGRGREPTPWLGPLFRYELVRLARRGQQPMLRTGYVAVLFVGLVVAYASEFGREQDWLDLFGGTANAPIDRTARFAETYLIVFLCLQAVAVLLVTPAIVGGAIAEDKERGTFDHLRASLLSDREIVLGKLAARLAFVGSVLLTGMPVLALTLLFGGVDGRRLLIGFAVCGLGAASLGAFSIMMAVRRDGFKEVLVNAYVVVAGLTSFGLCCSCVPGFAAGSPLSTVAVMFSDVHGRSETLFWANVGTFGVIHSVAFVICSRRAVRHVRPGLTDAANRTTRLSRHPPWEVRSAGPAAGFGMVAGLPVAEPDRPFTDLPRFRPDYNRDYLRTDRRFFRVPGLRDDTDPLLWKERYFTGRLEPGQAELLRGCGVIALSAVVCVAGLALFSIAVGGLTEGRWDPTSLNRLIRVLVVGGGLLVAVTTGVKTAATVARERQKGTLESLLTIPCPRAELLRAKLVAAGYSVRFAPVAVGVVLAGGIVTAAVHPAAAAAAVVILAGNLSFSVTLGLWLSVRCLTVPRATTTFLLVTAGTWVGFPLLGGLIGFGHGFAADLGTALSPAAGLWTALPTWKETFDGNRGLFWVELGLGAGMAYIGIALLLWWDSVRRFEAEGR